MNKRKVPRGIGYDDRVMVELHNRVCLPPAPLQPAYTTFVRQKHSNGDSFIVHHDQISATGDEWSVRLAMGAVRDLFRNCRNELITSIAPNVIACKSGFGEFMLQHGFITLDPKSDLAKLNEISWFLRGESRYRLRWCDMVREEEKVGVKCVKCWALHRFTEVLVLDKVACRWFASWSACNYAEPLGVALLSKERWRDGSESIIITIPRFRR